MAIRYGVVAAIGAYLLALALMRASIPSGVQREWVSIGGPQGEPCSATMWTPRAPKGVILLGHGVSSNRGVMATAAKAFARNGYAAVAFDFWGHGRSRERFDWRSNPAQVLAWCGWARERYQGLPLAYLGHSMGGFSGAEAFTEPAAVDAFVALGALPRSWPSCPTLVAAGRFEELFTPAEAGHRASGHADVIISPYSNHALETWDPKLLSRIVSWVDHTLGFPSGTTFPWLRWGLALLGTIVGCVAALHLAEALAGIRHPHARPAEPREGRRRWSANPYRVAGRMFGCKGIATPPRSGGMPLAALRGIVFAAVFITLLSFLLSGHIFTCSLNHPGRCLVWLALAPCMALFVFTDTWLLERVPLKNARGRFAVAALTRAVPLLAAGMALRFVGSGLAFAGMLLGILAFVLVMLSAIHTMATRGAEDYCAGAFASAIVLAWTISFWLPYAWG